MALAETLKAVCVVRDYKTSMTTVIIRNSCTTINDSYCKTLIDGILNSQGELLSSTFPFSIHFGLLMSALQNLRNSFEQLESSVFKEVWCL
jgi:hypothetical protein